MKYTIEEANKYSNENKLDIWLQSFLRDNNNDHANPNIPLADGLLLEERFYLGPILFDLDNITPVRIENHLQGNELKYYNEVVDRIKNDYNNYNLPPLILEYKDNKFYLTDGNHRYSALKKLKIDKYYVIVWGNKNIKDKFINTYKNKN